MSVDPLTLRRRILHRVGDPGARPPTARGLLRFLGLPREELPALRRQLSLLAEEGEIVGSRGHWFPAEATRPLRGRFLRHPDGYGFVRPEGDGESDVHLPARRAAGLMHGDRVEVAVLRRDARGRGEGRLLRVVEPASRRVTGVLELRGRDARVFPFEERIARFVLVGASIPEAADDGFAVGVEVSDPPDDDGVARGRIVEVLGRPEAPGVDIEIITRRFDLRQDWPEEVVDEVARLPGEVDADALEGREDFSEYPTVTIDGETAKDFDDAVAVQRLADGGWRLHVHVADVAHYVTPGGPTDLEARERGTSVYFPGKAIPMLPERLSNHLCSLRPHVPRLVRTAVLELDAAGEVRRTRFAEGWIRSAERMTYRAVAGILVERDPELMERYAPLVDRFREMEELCRRLQARRRRRGSLDFDLPEPEIVLNARGEMTGVFPSARTVAHRIIEEFMLAANEAVASKLLEDTLPGLFRVHESPEPTKLEALDEVLQGLGYRLPRPLEDLRPGDLQQLLEAVQGRPEERFVSRLVLRALQQARYDPANLGHFGLAAARYTHFTSPIRRYPDLLVHRVLRDQATGALDAGRVTALRADLPGVATHASRTERTAEEAERTLEEWKKLGFMAERVGDEYRGFVSAVMPFGLFVELEEYYVEGLVHISTLQGRYRFDERGHCLRREDGGRTYRLGDRLEVRVARVDAFRKRMDLEILGEEPSRGRRRGRRRRRRGR
ncbi:MAG: ribonuclease R [Acidobacteriota bacterium]|jgi:ribonuclease R